MKNKMTTTKSFALTLFLGLVMFVCPAHAQQRALPA